MFHKFIFVTVIVGLGLMDSVNAATPEHITQATEQGASYMKSLTSLMYACSDLATALETTMLEKCIGLVDNFNVKMSQYFAENKIDMDAIMQKALDLQGQGSSSVVPQYNYERRQ